jgi:hypothetical protein
MMSWKLIIEAGNRVFNINKLKNCDDNFKEYFYRNFREYLVNKYKMNSPDDLFEIIKYVLGEDSYLKGRDELKINSFNSNSSAIGGFSKWKMIVDDYYFLTEDKAIYDVEWENIIGFTGDFLDFNQMPEDLCKILFPMSNNMNEQLCSEGRNFSRNEALILLDDSEKYMEGNITFEYDLNPILDCEVNYESSIFKFLYQMGKKEGNITKNPKIQNFKMFLE